MFRISKGVEYAIKGLIYLVSQPPNKTIPLSEVSEAEDIPKSFLIKIFQMMMRRGIVKSERGLDGGFMLARSPYEISLLEVIEAVDGPLSAFYNGRDNDYLDPLHNIYKEGIDTLSEIFKVHTIGQIAEDKKSLKL